MFKILNKRNKMGINPSPKGKRPNLPENDGTTICNTPTFTKPPRPGENHSKDITYKVYMKGVIEPINEWFYIGTLSTLENARKFKDIEKQEHTKAKFRITKEIIKIIEEDK